MFKNFYTNQEKRNSKGFTLIELLVVIAIISVLSAVVLSSLNSARKKARDARRVSDMKTMQLALALYYNTNGSYPVFSPFAFVQGINGSLSPYVGGGVVPCDPSYTAVVCNAANGGSGYAYYSADGSTYHLGAAVEQNNISVLASDADVSSGPNDFNGNGATCGLSAAGAWGVACYDLVP